MSYGTSPGNYQFSVKAPAATINRVVLQDLKPGTVYYYQVKTATTVTPAGDANYFFKTAYSGAEPFRFAVYADTSSGRNGFDMDHGRVVRSIINNTHPEFVIVNGDMVTNGKSKEDWIRFLGVEKELLKNVPIYAVLGNNDQNGRSYFRGYFTSPRRNPWYSFNRGGCHFIALDIMRGQGEKYYNSFKPGNPQFTWLLKDLQSEANRNAKFTIVFFHAPVFPPDGKENKALLQLLHPLFVKYGVDVVFNGSHSYTRAEKDGIQYLVSGGGGAELIPMDRPKRPEIKETAFVLHHLRVSVNYPIISIEVVDINGSVFSSFTYWDPNAKSAASRPGLVPPTKETTNLLKESTSKDGLPVTVFSLPNCGYCKTILEKKLPKIAKETGFKLKVAYLPLDKADNFERLVAVEQQLKDSGNDLPAVLVGNQLLGGKKEIDTRLRQLIIITAKGQTITANQPDTNAATGATKKEIRERFKSFKLLPIILAGLLDGINPCAFTAIIFLLSYLFYLGKKKREVLIAGISFSVGVFLTYTALGMGFSEILKSLAFYGTVTMVIKYLTLGLVLVLGILSLYDFVLCLRGRLSEVTLQLPDFLKKKIHQQVREQTRKSHLVMGSMVLGVVVSTFELACTGQIYVPTIIYMLKISSERLRAYGYLLLYNLAFIIPLILVFIFAYYGLTAEALTKVFRKNVTLVKLATAVFFFLMGVLILVL